MSVKSFIILVPGEGLEHAGPDLAPLDPRPVLRDVLRYRKVLESGCETRALRAAEILAQTMKLFYNYKMSCVEG